MITDEEIDEALLANITDDWRKVARVVGSAMSHLGNRRAGRNDLYFAERVALLAERGLIEYEGDLAQMGRCEIRFAATKKGRLANGLSRFRLSLRVKPQS